MLTSPGAVSRGLVEVPDYPEHELVPYLKLTRLITDLLVMGSLLMHLFEYIFIDFGSITV